ncbi:hypothetical protein AMTRI_Chr03g45740 [Amborella trichopoda]
MQYATDFFLLEKRKLQSIDDFKEIFKCYSNDFYTLRLHNNETCNAYYHASLPGNILELVLGILSMKNIAVQNMVMANVVGYGRGQIKKLYYIDCTKTVHKSRI